METWYLLKKTLLSVSIVIIGFFVYFLITRSAKLKSILQKKFDEEQSQIRFILVQRLSGILFFGILPVTVFLLFGFDLKDYGFKLKFDLIALLTVLILGGLLGLMNFFAARSEHNLAIYPQIRIKTWSWNLLLLSAASWMSYLLAYEILFRGILLFSCYQELGLFKAIIINTLLYALVHIPKGAKEVLGSIPLGIVLCLISLYFGTFWAAFWIHCFLALSNEWFSIKYSRDIKIIRN